MGKVMQVASFSLAEVTYITGDISYQVQESVKNAQFRVRAKQENVSGVMLPAFESYQEGTNGTTPTIYRAQRCWSYRLSTGTLRYADKIQRETDLWFIPLKPFSQRTDGSWPWRTTGPKVQGNIHQGRGNAG